MVGMNISVSAGLYTFSNLGPVTTTFTPPPACTASNQLALGSLDTRTGIYVYLSSQCTATVDFEDCTPTTTSEPTTTGEPVYGGGTDWIEYDGYGVYYSPGLYCPKGWKTIGMAARDASSVLTSSGFLVPTTTSTSTSTSTRTATPTPYSDYDYDYDYDEDYDYDSYTTQDPASVLMSALEPKQTMALCCPEHMTADHDGACYSIAETYTPTTGCEISTTYDYEYGRTVSTYTRTYTYSDDEGSETDVITNVGTFKMPTATATHVRTVTTTFDPEDRGYYTGMYYAPIITILHHESDLDKAAEETESAEAEAEAAAEASESPSNAAGRLGGNSRSAWEGVGAVMGIWAVAGVLGGVLVLPW
ncbi:uncharacterized protein DSM5745_10178 [Aspergillus mulundensis]|uniref:Uncharacterized protein n=1 Tax=Aspergillus mulundensis TaxID=1810919 RepID=A0A3D8QMQ9_9EURO|nr:Uncharacterized protein DSM5745_10178 [Aspergillus mulundensis]RDW63067.1 Uncharacterized protein DSM5745_10178 [Aspergillus mulundensis]